MRVFIFLLTTLIGCGAAQAAQSISQQTLDQTLLDAQNAIEAQNYTEAFALYQTAAHWGHKGAQYVLGELYLRGKGVDNDPVMAYAWLVVAAEAPDRQFIRARNEAADELTTEQMQEATEVAEQLAASYGIEAAGMVCRREARIGSNVKAVNCYYTRTNANGDLIVPDAADPFAPAS